MCGGSSRRQKAARGMVPPTPVAHGMAGGSGVGGAVGARSQKEQALDRCGSPCQGGGQTPPELRQLPVQVKWEGIQCVRACLCHHDLVVSQVMYGRGTTTVNIVCRAWEFLSVQRYRQPVQALTTSAIRPGGVPWERPVQNALLSRVSGPQQNLLSCLYVQVA